MSDTSLRTRAFGETRRSITVGERRRRAILAVLAFGTAAIPFVLRLVLNAPGSTLAAFADSYESAVLAATVVPALAAGGLAVETADPIERVALLGIAVFGPLVLVADAAYVPAAVAVTVAGGVVAWRRLDHRDVDATVPRVGGWLLAGTAVAAVGASLAATVGFAPMAVRQAGSVLALVAALATAMAVNARTDDWAVGAVAASLVYAAGTFAPYVTGAVALVAGGAVGSSLPLLAAGIGSVTAATVASIRRRDLIPTCGALLVLVAGVPVTVPRALAVLLGVAFLLGGEQT